MVLNVLKYNTFYYYQSTLAVVMLLPVLVINETHANSIHVKNSYTKYVENTPMV
jgi:hypothetical protein